MNNCRRCPGVSGGSGVNHRVGEERDGTLRNPSRRRGYRRVETGKVAPAASEMNRQLTAHGEGGTKVGEMQGDGSPPADRLPKSSDCLDRQCSLSFHVVKSGTFPLCL